MPYFLAVSDEALFWGVMGTGIAVILCIGLARAIRHDWRGNVFKNLAYEIMKERSVGRRGRYYLYADDLIDLIVARDSRFRTEAVGIMETWLMEIEIDFENSGFHYDDDRRTCSIFA
jgi:hypothetical protein